MRCSRGFSLVELIIVIGIISVLISILLPTLARVRDTAQRTSCLSNLRQIGAAVQMYLAENKGIYPHHEFWYNLSGKRGNLARYGIAPFPPVDQTGLRGEENTLVERPLNVYLAQSAAVSSCPADRGDARRPGVDSCFDAYGTSYMTQWRDGSSVAAFGVVPVTGGSVVNPNGGRIFDLSRPAARFGSGIRFNGQVYKGSWTTKILLGDFNWHGNRPITDARVLWHRPAKRNQRQQNMLFADGHAEFFTFPPSYGDHALPVAPALNGFW
jgi:prepilin-type N-terminal cleavage/methylation domain-containing protein